jgi:hypothetical protein
MSYIVRAISSSAINWLPVIAMKYVTVDKELTTVICVGLVALMMAR